MNAKQDSQSLKSVLTRRETLVLSAAGAVSLLLPGCGGGSSRTSGSNNSGNTLSFNQRSAILDAAGGHYDSLPHQSMDVDNIEMLRYLQTVPELTSLRLTNTGTIAGRFQDGAGFVFVNNLDDSRDTGRALPLPPRSRAAIQAPEGGKTVLLNGMGVIVAAGNVLFQFVNERRAAAHIDRLDSMFQLRGYTVRKDYASLANLRSIKETDVLYFIGHGGLGIDENDNEIYVINSSSPVDTANVDAELQPDLKANLVGYMVFTGEDETRARRWKRAYYITPKFVTNYMSFNKYSFVFINGCAAAPPRGAAFQKAFFDSQVSAYAGWDDKVNSGDTRDTAEFLFDRLLGANLSDVPGVKKTPPIRPFDYNSVLTEMRSTTRSDQPFLMSQSLDSDPPPPNETRQLANLIITPHPTDPDTFGILAPGLASMVADETNRKLTLFGSFGSIAGEVTLAGQPLTVEEWGSSTITCTLPATGAGDVVVKVGGHPSNPRRLTEWLLPLRYRGVGNGADGHTESADMLLRLRVDAQSRRPAVNANPDSTNLSFVSFTTASASTCDYSLSGEYRDRDTNGILNVINWSGSGKLNGGAGAGGEFRYSGHFDFNGKKLLLAFTASVPNTYEASQPEIPGDMPSKGAWFFQTSFFSVTQVTLPLDDNFGIPANSITGSFPSLANSLLPPMNLTLSWDATAPTSGTAPDPNGARHAVTANPGATG